MAQRYPEGLNPGNLPLHSMDGMLLFTAVIGVLVGFVLIVLGRHGKQLWMWTWGVGLIIFSIFMAVVIYRS